MATTCASSPSTSTSTSNSATGPAYPASSSQNNSPLQGLVIGLASLGGIAIVAVLAGFAIYFTIVLKIPWFKTSFYLLWLGIFTALLFTSVQLDSLYSEQKQGIIISQGIILGLCSILLGFSVYFHEKDNLSDQSAYIMYAIPVSLLLSVVSLSATTMSKLSSA
jgi:hypothetical protein